MKTTRIIAALFLVFTSSMLFAQEDSGIPELWRHRFSASFGPGWSYNDRAVVGLYAEDPDIFYMLQFGGAYHGRFMFVGAKLVRPVLKWRATYHPYNYVFVDLGINLLSLFYPKERSAVFLGPYFRIGRTTGFQTADENHKPALYIPVQGFGVLLKVPIKGRHSLSFTISSYEFEETVHRPTYSRTYYTSTVEIMMRYNYVFGSFQLKRKE